MVNIGQIVQIMNVIQKGNPLNNGPEITKMNNRIIGLGLWTVLYLWCLHRDGLRIMDGQITDSKHRRLFSVLTSAARQKITRFWIKNATLTTLIQVFSIRIWTPTRIILDQCCRLHCYWSPRSDQPVFVILSSQLTVYLCMLCTGRHLDPALFCCGRQKGRRQYGKYPHF